MSRSFQANNNIRHQVSSSEIIKKSTPYPKRVTFFDVFTFAVISAAIFFTNLTQRSILFNVVIAVALLLKIMIGCKFYRTNNSRTLRIYFMFRYLYNLLVIYPLLIISKFFTGTYTVNIFMAGGMLFVFEIFITLVYIQFLCFKKPLENIEDIPGFKVKSMKDDMIVLHMKTKDTADFIKKSLNTKNTQQIITAKQAEYNTLLKRQKQNTTKVPLTPIQILEQRKSYQLEPRGGFNLIRSEEEILDEIDYEEVVKAKHMKNKKFMTFEDKMSRNVVNDVIFIESKHQDNFSVIQDARMDIERERSKFIKFTKSNEILSNDSIVVELKSDNMVGSIAKEEDLETQSEREHRHINNKDSVISDSGLRRSVLKAGQPQKNVQFDLKPQQKEPSNNRSVEIVDDNQAKKEKYTSYQEKFEKQRIQQKSTSTQNIDQQKPPINTENHGNHVYSEEDDSDSNSDSYYSDSISKVRSYKKRQQRKHHQQRHKQGAESSSSLSDNEQNSHQKLAKHQTSQQNQSVMNSRQTASIQVKGKSDQMEKKQCQQETIGAEDEDQSFE